MKISKVKQLVLKQFRIISYICKSVQRHLDICLGFSGRKSPILPTLIATLTIKNQCFAFSKHWLPCTQLKKFRFRSYSEIYVFSMFPSMQCGGRGFISKIRDRGVATVRGIRGQAPDSEGGGIDF